MYGMLGSVILLSHVTIVVEPELQKYAIPVAMPWTKMNDPDRAWEISILGGNEMAEPKYRIFYTPQKPRTFLVLTMVNKSQTNKDYFKWRMRFLKIQVCKENVWRIPNEHKPS